MKYYREPVWLKDKKPTWVKEHEEALEKYYKEPVRPVSQYCDAFYRWKEVLEENAKEESFFLDYVKAMNDLSLPITKSSYLGRRIYGGERHRTKMCPIHKGVWSGLPFGKEPCGCDLTGWIYEGKDGE